MANNFKRRSLKGVVLIMVVTVMLMLIILLLATMAVVSTAQNRYYTKFEENQAYYTARSALDVYVSNIFSDESYLAYDGATVKQYSYTDGAGAVQTTDMKQGLAMQLDTYRIKAHSDTMENYNLMADKTQFSTDHWANATNDIFNTGSPEKTYYEVPDLDYIDYQIEFPKVENGTNSYGGIVDTDSSNKQIAKIRVEVLARTYNGHSASYVPADMTTDKEAIKNSERYKDAVYLKATSIVEFQGVEGTASVVFSAPEMENQFTSAVTATGSINSLNHGLIIDGYATPFPIAPTNDLTFVGKSYVGGQYDITTGNGSGNEMSRGECCYYDQLIASNKFFTSSIDTVTSPGDVPLVYVEKNCTFGAQTSWGGGYSVAAGDQLNKQVDLFVGGDLTVNGDFDVNGNIYVKGDVYVNGSKFNIAPACALYVGGDLIISSQGAFKDNWGTTRAYVGGNVEYTGGSPANYRNLDRKTIYIKNGSSYVDPGYNVPVDQSTYILFQDTRNVDGPSLGKFGGFDSDAFKYTDIDKAEADATAGATPDLAHTEAGWEVLLPHLNGNNVEPDMGSPRYVPSDKSKYSLYWHHDSSGTPAAYAATDQGVVDGYANVGDVYISAEEMAGTKKKSDREAGNYTALDFSTPPVGAIVITGDINSGGDYILRPGSCNFKINAPGEVNIYVQGSGDYGGDYQNILISDNTKVNFYFPGGSSNTYTMKMPIWNQEVKDAVSAGNVRTGDKTADPNVLSSPKIKYYIGAGAKLHFDNGKSMFAGYIYAPYANITANTPFGGFGGSKQYYYDNALVINMSSNASANEPPLIIGAVVCNNLAPCNGCAFCYIKDEDSPEFGDPFWDSGDPFYYTRN